MRIISISLLLLFLCFSVFPIFAEKGYVFHILDVSHPEVVKPNERFNIDVKIGYWIGPYYRTRIQLQIRVFDYNNDGTILIENFQYNQFMVSGEDIHTLTLTAPSYKTLWRLSIRAYLIATHYDLSHAENNWYRDIQIQVSEFITETTYSLSTSKEILTTSISSTLIVTLTEVRTTTAYSVSSFIGNYLFYLLAVIMVAIIVAISILVKCRSRGT